MAVTLAVILAVLSAGTLTSLVFGLIQLGRLIEKIESLEEDADEIRSMQDAQSERLTEHFRQHWR